MHLSEDLQKKYTRETLKALDAQRLAEFIAWGPVIFQVARIMVRSGILESLRLGKGLTLSELAQSSGLSKYAVQCLMEASLSIGLVKVDPETDRFSITKTGWFLLNDPATKANMNFNHDVNYRGMFHLEQALKEGKPEGLKTLGDWPTIYEGLSSLPKAVQDSWFGFDHFYSDSSFGKALEMVFASHPRTILDVGGNTGRWALQCVSYDPEVKVTIMDLPQQLGLMKEAVGDGPEASRIDGIGVNLLDKEAVIPQDRHFDVIWMSQFLDCFSEAQVVDILRRITPLLEEGGSLYIMETLWDRQRFEAASMCLTLTSLYFTAMANGNSKMFHSQDLERLISEAGLGVTEIHDGLGQGHSILICKKL